MKSKGFRAAILSAAFVAVTLSLAVWLGWAHLQFWWRFEEIERSALGYHQYRHRSLDTILVRLPYAFSIRFSGQVTKGESYYGIRFRLIQIGKPSSYLFVEAYDTDVEKLRSLRLDAFSERRRNFSVE